MASESIAIPSERLPPIASDQASSSKSAAGVLIFLAAVFVFAIVGMLAEGQSMSTPRDGLPEKGGDLVGAIIGLMIVAGLPGLFGIRAARNASRATRAAKAASTDPSYTWRLFGKDVFADDAAGVPHPELSFKVNGKLRKMLLHVPRASVVTP